jgi:hypothetical protein
MKINLDCENDCTYCRARACHCGCGSPVTFNRDGPVYGYRNFAHGHNHNWIRQRKPRHGVKFARHSFLWLVHLKVAAMLEIEPMTCREIRDTFGPDFPITPSGLGVMLSACPGKFERAASGRWSRVGGPKRRQRVAGTAALSPWEDSNRSDHASDKTALRPDDIAAMDECLNAMSLPEREMVVGLSEHGMVEAVAVQMGIALPEARRLLSEVQEKLAG